MKKTISLDVKSKILKPKYDVLSTSKIDLRLNMSLTTYANDNKRKGKASHTQETICVIKEAQFYS